MVISTKGRYALRMMLDIAVHQGEGYVALKDTAQREEISKKYLEQIALQLTQAGLLRAVRGHENAELVFIDEQNRDALLEKLLPHILRWNEA